MDCTYIWILATLVIVFSVASLRFYHRKKREKNPLYDKNKFLPMTRWYSFEVLADAARRSIISNVFGRYADRRLILAALDKNDIRPTHEIDDSQDDVWIDFVADTGDGFEPTYTILYLLAQPSINVAEQDGKNTLTLPRADLLVFGGDQVYPTPSKNNYKNRFTKLCDMALPEDKNNKLHKPLAFLLPGNHDWYDGLNLFLALFCGSNKQHIGNWTVPQNRSYFAIKLPNNFWIFGIDSQLGEDIDQPQSDYFLEIVTKFTGKNNVILCVSSPKWHDVCSKEQDKKEAFYRAADYIANDIILEKIKEKKDSTEVNIRCVLTGDLHHYSRYVSKKSHTQFITAGGGGAFLHPTHQLKRVIDPIKWCDVNDQLILGHDKDKPGNEACYPQQRRSRILSLFNLGFFFKNISFCMLVGLIYSVIAIFIMPGNFSEVMKIKYWYLPILFLLMTLRFSYDKDKKSLSILGGALHGMLQFYVAMVFTNYYLLSMIEPIASIILEWFCITNQVAGDILHFIINAICFGFVFGLVIGVFLAIACGGFDLHSNEGFSSFYHKGYKNFLRIHITKDMIEIYPIGVKKIIKRRKWIFNSNVNPDNPSGLVPQENIDYRLIEAPIVIRLNKEL